MKSKINWLIPFVLTAAAGVVVLQNSLAPAPPNAATETAVDINAPSIIFTDTPAPQGSCAYTWAYHDAPELTGKFSGFVTELVPNATARASTYGEDCVYADGHADFHVMETDFYAQLPVKDLSDEAALGNWTAQIMQIVVKIPRAEIQGNYGFVEFRFEKNEAERVILRVPVQKYKDEAQGKSGVELYQLFSNAP
jgi:hypothetical protein